MVAEIGAGVRGLIDIFNHIGGDRCVPAMEGLGKLDFHGLEMLVLINDVAQAKGVTLTIRRPRGRVGEMLVPSGLDRNISVEMSDRSARIAAPARLLTASLT